MTVDLAYEVHGPDAAPVLLLIAGLGAQRGWWPPAFVGRLAATHRVVRRDNRDVGRSPWMDHLDKPSVTMAAWGAGQMVPPPYSLREMAADVIALLDRLGVDRAHVLGASMGGMIAQHLAFGWPERVATLTSMMSTTGAPDVPPGDPQVLAVLTASAPIDDLDAFLDAGAAGARASAGPHFDEADARRRNRAYWDGGLNPDASGRHILAVLADGDRTERLAAITAPTLVIHGQLDPMIRVEGGRATAAAIAGAQLLELPEIGHELPAAMHVRVADAVLAHTGVVHRAVTHRGVADAV
jgi:pimeloyl-ACP methyl ester carboxylesterase